MFVDLKFPNGRRSRTYNNAAFTLVELLIVIAIIALLAAILFPVFARARENARRATCQSNMKQIALSFIQYAADYDERLPHAWDADLSYTTAQNSFNTCANCYTGTTYEPMIWPAKIEPYLGSRQVFQCPNARTVVQSPCGGNMLPQAVAVWPAGYPTINVRAGTSYWYYGASQVSYGYNVYYLGGERWFGLANCLNQGINNSLPYSNGIGAHLSDISFASSTVLICDNYFSNNSSANSPAFLDFPSLKLLGADGVGDLACRADGTWEAYDSIPERHLGGLNVAFVDGHVKFMKKANLTYGLSSESCQGANAVHTSNDPNFLWNRY